MGKVIAGLTLAGEVAIMAAVVYASTFGYAGTAYAAYSVESVAR